jgi:hypothetical protein
LCGDLLVGSEAHNDFNRNREDDLVPIVFHVTDVRDPHRPRSLSIRNVLEGKGLPADLIWDTYMKGFDKRVNVGCYHGIAPWSHLRVGGATPHGDRLYLQTNLGMYCIGREALGSPKDDPAIVKAIAAAAKPDSLLAHLSAERPRYRRDALLRLASLKQPVPEAERAALEKLVMADPFEEVRAAAICALNAADAAGKAGWAVFATELAAAEKASGPWNEEAQQRLRTLALTLRALGDDGKAWLARAVPDATDVLLRRGVLGLAADLGLADPALTDAALAAVQDKSQRADPKLVQCAADYLGNVAFADPRALPALRASPALQSEGIQGLLVLALCHRTPDAELAGTVEHILRTVPARHGFPWQALTHAVRRLGAARAVPLLEKIAAEKADVAQKCKEAIAAVGVADVDPRPEAQPAK